MTFHPRFSLWIFAVAAVLGGVTARAAERIPPKPTQYFNDYAGIVSPTTAASLNHELADYERESSNQLVVVVYPHMESDSSIEDYTVRVAQQWGVGQKDRRNGAVLFVFARDRKMYIQVGYGLEPVLTDATCFQIIRNEITPHFRAGDYAGGLKAGIESLIAASRGEYRGTGRTRAETQRHSGGFSVFGVVPFILILIFIGTWSRRRQRRVWTGSPYSRYNDPFNSGGPWVGGGGFGGFGGGGFGGGGGNDSFSSGGGSFGGGGAGGSW